MLVERIFALLFKTFMDFTLYGRGLRPDHLPCTTTTLALLIRKFTSKTAGVKVAQLRVRTDPGSLLVQQLVPYVAELSTDSIRPRVNADHETYFQPHTGLARQSLGLHSLHPSYRPADVSYNQNTT
jgi:hypothetical protein